MSGPTPIPHPYTIVVGVSATSRSPAALQWAVDLAALRGGRVFAVRAWRPTPPQSSSHGLPAAVSERPAEAEAAAAERLAADVTEVLGAGHDVECRLVRGGRRKALLAAASTADLLVIDAPRRTDLSSSPVFAQRLVGDAACPVLVMPPTGPGAAHRLLGRATEELVRAAGQAGRPGIRPPSVEGHDTSAQ